MKKTLEKLGKPKNKAILDGCLAGVGMGVLLVILTRHRIDAVLAWFCALNVGVFAWSSGMSLAKHFWDRVKESSDRYIEELEKYNRELRQDYYSLLANFNLKQDLSEVELSDEP